MSHTPDAAPSRARSAAIAAQVDISDLKGARAALRAVLAQHRPEFMGGEIGCHECSDPAPRLIVVRWPCRTVDIIDAHTVQPQQLRVTPDMSMFEELRDNLLRHLNGLCCGDEDCSDACACDDHNCQQRPRHPFAPSMPDQDRPR
jgi:hypothetical protein